MIRVIPFTANIHFNDNLTPVALKIKLYTLLMTYHTRSERDLILTNIEEFKTKLHKMQSISDIINSVDNYIQPYPAEFYSDMNFQICDFQKPFFDEIAVSYIDTI